MKNDRDAQEGQKPRGMLRTAKWVPIAGAFMVGITLSLVVFLFAAKWERERIRVAFVIAARNQISALRTQMRSHLGTIDSLAGFYAASREVEREEFDRFVLPLLENQSAILAIEWAPYVSQQLREDFERQATQPGRPPFRIHEWTSQGAGRVAAERGSYLPVLYVQPQSGNEVALGFDLASESARLAALETAADTGRTIMTSPIRLVQHAALARGLLMVRSVYRQQEVGAAAPSGRKQVAGYVVGVFRVDLLMKQAFSELVLDPIDTYLFDESTPNDIERVFVHSYDPQAKPPTVYDDEADPRLPALHHVEKFTMAGRRLSVMCVARPAFATIRQNWHHWGIGGSGLMFTLLLTAYLLSAAGRAHRVEQLVEERTRDLAQANEELLKQVSDRRIAEAALAVTQTEFGLARRVQMGLLPVSPPSVGGIDIAGASFPAYNVSGDHFDFINVDNERLGIVIGDASGHGLAAAMLMVEIRACLRSAVNPDLPLGEILGIANRVLSEGMLDDHFITLLMASLDTTNRSLVYANAGHPSGFVIDGKGRTKHTLASQTPPLGIDGQMPFVTSETVELDPGDLLLLVTDGVLDAMSPEGEFFGEQRLLDVVKQHMQESSAGIISRLHEAIAGFCGDNLPHDDVTAVIVKIASAEAGPMLHGQSHLEASKLIAI